MRLASLRDAVPGTPAHRDGTLVLVDRAMRSMVHATDIAPTLQAVLDDWKTFAPALRDLAMALEAGTLKDAGPFDPSRCLAPLPRAYQWADASAYVNHVALVRRARGAELPESFWEDPLIYQGGSDGFLGPTDDIALAHPDFGLDFEAEIAVVTDDVPMGVDPEEAAGHIRLLMLVNDVSLRGLIPGELAKGFGFFQSKPPSAFAPLAVTPDELGDAWDGRKLHLPLSSYLNGTLFGRPEAGEDMTFDFPRLIAHAARTRPLGAGTIIGSGTVSNRDPDGGPGRPVAWGGRGYSCIAEQRVVETIRDGAPTTPFLRTGDHVRIEMVDPDGHSLFGAIDARVTAYSPYSTNDRFRD
ncbi:fumarylacetoacetate hydrolase family protein [Marivibrio halodurans]|uniref:Fumarylacetoacetate hydrolase family protein n=1 Tax=Marivibrio halodurans TaxID=2039722 RepID=A0A8J7V2T3_9PROT|nr:fumarylacetoacetate hydrolase family protein [Marivibrio halodurans]MBP5857670.1 fumarylacetoacetate hydrolase family protein [Marivibrio halodurans]